MWRSILRAFTSTGRAPEPVETPPLPKPVLAGEPFRRPTEKKVVPRTFSSDSDSSSDSDCDFSYPQLRSHIQFRQAQRTEQKGPVRTTLFKSKRTWSDDESSIVAQSASGQFSKPELISGPFVKEQSPLAKPPVARCFSSSTSSSEESDAIILDRRCSARSVKFCGTLPGSAKAQQVQKPVASILKSPQNTASKQKIEIQEGSEMDFNDDSWDEDIPQMQPVKSKFVSQSTPRSAGHALSHFVTPKSSDAHLDD